jgi:hypothetical protein
VQFAASIVATSQGTPVEGEPPSAPTGEPLLLELPELLPDADPPGETPPEDEVPVELLPEEDDPEPSTTITLSGGAEEHAPATATTTMPNAGAILMSRECRAAFANRRAPSLRQLGDKSGGFQWRVRVHDER